MQSYNYFTLYFLFRLPSLLLFPLFTLTHRAQSTKKNFERESRSERNGRAQECKVYDWLIRPSFVLLLFSSFVVLLAARTAAKTAAAAALLLLGAFSACAPSTFYLRLLRTNNYNNKGNESTDVQAEAEAEAEEEGEEEQRQKQSKRDASDTQPGARPHYAKPPHGLTLCACIGDTDADANSDGNDAGGGGVDAVKNQYCAHASTLSLCDAWEVAATVATASVSATEMVVLLQQSCASVLAVNMCVCVSVCVCMRACVAVLFLLLLLEQTATHKKKMK